MKIAKLTAGYGPRMVLKELDLHVNEGERVALIGANGSGKSTFFAALAGLARVTEGEATINGTKVDFGRVGSVVSAGVAFVPQGRHVFSEMSVKENLLLGSRARRNNDAITEDLQALLDLFPALNTRWSVQAGKLSGGEQQMLAVARALLARPRFLCLDEPCLGISPKLSHEIYEALAKPMWQGIGMIIADPDLHRLFSFASRGYVLDFGTIAKTGSLAELVADPSLAILVKGTGWLDQ